MHGHWLTLWGLQETAVPATELKQSQVRWLKACLQHNQGTCFGQQYGFHRIDSVRAYQERVPLLRHTDFTPWIDQMARGEADILFKGNTVAFEQTGGSSGGSKLIPYSASSLDDIRKAILPWLGCLIATHQIDSGSVYLSLSPVTRQSVNTAGNIPVGLPDEAYLGREAGQALMALSAMPAWVGAIPDIMQWQLATLYWLIRRHDLTLISLWSPSFFLQLLKGLEERRHELTELLNSGGRIVEQSLHHDRSALKGIGTICIISSAAGQSRAFQNGCFGDISSSTPKLTPMIPHSAR
jgi:hypothetical protein